MKKKNVLFITTDQQRADLIGYQGHFCLETPNLDSLAQEGMIMENAYCTTPLCVPSRTTIFNSLYGSHPQNKTGLVNKITLGQEQLHLPGILKEEGYQLAIAGKNHAFTEDYIKTWDFCELYDLRGKEEKEFCSPLSKKDRKVREWRNNREIVPQQEGVVNEPQPGGIKADPNYSQTEYALDFLNNKDDEKPFFMYYSFESPHFPYVVPEPYFSMYDIEEMPGPRDHEPLFAGKPLRLFMQYYGQQNDKLSEKDYKRIQATYLAQISLVDQQIGKVIEHLKEISEFDNTIIIFASDHGDFWGNHGLVGKTNAVYEDLIHIPMFWVVPDFKGGKRCPALVENTDITPTILELLNIDQPQEMQGKSMVPLLSASKKEHREKIVAESHLASGPALTRKELKEAIRTRDQLKKEEGHGWFGQRQKGWVRSLMYSDKKYKVITNENDMNELYNLKKDPEERNNLALQSKYQDITQNMINELNNINLDEKT